MKADYRFSLSQLSMKNESFNKHDAFMKMAIDLAFQGMREGMGGLLAALQSKTEQLSARIWVALSWRDVLFIPPVNPVLCAQVRSTGQNPSPYSMPVQNTMQQKRDLAISLSTKSQTLLPKNEKYPSLSKNWIPQKIRSVNGRIKMTRPPLEYTTALY